MCWFWKLLPEAEPVTHIRWLKQVPQLHLSLTGPKRALLLLLFPISLHGQAGLGEPGSCRLGLCTVTVAGACPTYPHAGVKGREGLEPRFPRHPCIGRHQAWGQPTLVSSSPEALGKEFCRSQGKPSLQASLRGPGPTLLRVRLAGCLGRPDAQWYWE